MKFFSNLQLGSALLVSSVLHFVVIVGIPGIGMLTFNKPVPQMDEMTYIAVAQMQRPQASQPAKAIEAKPVKLMQQPIAKRPHPVAKRVTHPKLQKAVAAKPHPAPAVHAFVDKPLINKLSESDILALRNSPLYRDYCQIIREAIRDQATAYYNRFAEIGEVTLSFVLQSDGTLKEVNVIDDFSTENEYLREVASRSVIDAAPFPAFPKGFPIRELIFKLPISFRGGRIDLS